MDDIKASLQRLLDTGATTQRAITDVGGSKLIALAKDADGNIIGLLHAP